MQLVRVPSALLSHLFPGVIPWVCVTPSAMGELGTKTLSLCGSPGAFSWKMPLAAELELSADIWGVQTGGYLLHVEGCLDCPFDWDSCAREYPGFLETPSPWLQSSPGINSS